MPNLGLDGLWLPLLKKELRKQEIVILFNIKIIKFCLFSYILAIILLLTYMTLLNMFLTRINLYVIMDFMLFSY